MLPLRVAGWPGGMLYRVGRRFGWLWAAYSVSTFGTWLAFDAFPLIAILALHASPGRVSLLSAAGLAAGAALAVPLGSWIERRRKRRVMIGMDLARFGVLASVPVAYGLGRLTFGHLLAVAVVVGAADIGFRAASGAFLKTLVPRAKLLVANGRFESTQWTATMLGPPLGGAAIGLFGPVTTVVVDALSYLLSAFGLRAVGGTEPRPSTVERHRWRAVLEGWRYLFGHPVLRPLFLNVLLVNGLILAPAPLLAVLMLGQLGMAPWQYGLAFAAPCVGGLLGSRLARPVTARFGADRTLRLAGTARACWSVALAFVPAGWAGVVFVMVVQFGLVTCAGVFNPVLATYRLEHTPDDRVARVLSAWTVSTKAAVAVLTALWGLLAGLLGTREAIFAAGVALVLTPALLRRPTDRRRALSDRSASSGSPSSRFAGR